MTTDPFEEFEFKPLTDGLGFHKKGDKKAATATQPADLSPDGGLAPRFELKNSLPEIEMPRTSKPLGSQAPQPGSTLIRTKTETPEVSGAVDDILKTLQEKRKLDFVKAKPQVKHEPLFQMATIDFSAVLMDAMLVTASSLGCLIILLMVTKVDLFALLTTSPDVSALLGIGGIFAANAWIYLVINRVFLGYTPGEWVFDQRLGLPIDHGKNIYGVQVALRATVVVLTGVILLPILSMITRTDLAGKITGLSLFRKV